MNYQVQLISKESSSFRKMAGKRSLARELRYRLRGCLQIPQQQYTTNSAISDLFYSKSAFGIAIVTAGESECAR